VTLLKIKAQTTIIISIIITLAGIFITSAVGFWTTESTKIPKKLSQDQTTLQSSTENPMQYDPADIKGSYTFSEISNLYDIPIEDLAAAFLVEESAAKDFKGKDLEGSFTDYSNDIGTSSLRMFVAFYHGLPYELSEGTYVTDSAASILKQRSNMSIEQLEYLEMHTVIVSQVK